MLISIQYDTFGSGTEQETREKNEKILKHFFAAGVTPDCAQNVEEADTLEGAFYFTSIFLTCTTCWVNKIIN